MKEQRIRAGYSKARAAKALGISLSTFDKYERSGLFSASQRQTLAALYAGEELPTVVKSAYWKTRKSWLLAQKALLFIVAAIDAGRPPSFAEIGNAVGKSASAARGYVKLLENKQWLVWPREYKRALRVTVAGRAANDELKAQNEQ